jgi:dephospho-CoA kinase
VRVGLTGGIASGKSTVGAILRELGAVVIDADRLSRDAVAPGTPGLADVVRAFGPELLAEDGALDRAALARRVFEDPEARRRLEGIVHPLVRRAAAAEEATAAPGVLVVHDIPLLVETGQASSFDAVVVVDVPEAVQVQRMLADRGWTREEALSRIAAQASRADRLAAATHVVDNSGSLAELRDQVVEVHRELSRLTAPPPGGSGPTEGRPRGR